MDLNPRHSLWIRLFIGAGIVVLVFLILYISGLAGVVKEKAYRAAMGCPTMEWAESLARRVESLDPDGRLGIVDCDSDRTVILTVTAGPGTPVSRSCAGIREAAEQVGWSVTSPGTPPVGQQVCDYQLKVDVEGYPAEATVFREGGEVTVEARAID
ncbi:MAG: hypothetical protein Q8P38_03360 [Candidatus Nanopelagicales bacterium]|nr:hypothetical protein [Candidatus Nanopelagicales bacterium]MDZ7577685.1 hypothetical protein [Candidatus Nanopelagicales bacterium]